MNKITALNAINNAVKEYEKNFINKQLLLVYGSAESPDLIEISGKPEHFLHLTGVKLTSAFLSSVPNSTEYFYKAAVNLKLSTADFELKADGTTEMKLDVLEDALDLKKNFRRVGEYDKHRKKFDSDFIVGYSKAIVGFVNAGKCYVPNSVMKTGVSKEVTTKSDVKVLAIFSKQIKHGVPEANYSDILYAKDKVFIQKLIDTLQTAHPEIGISVNLSSCSLEPSRISQERELQKQDEIKKKAATLLAVREEVNKDDYSGTGKEYFDKQEEFLKVIDADDYIFAKKILEKQKKRYKSPQKINEFDTETIDRILSTIDEELAEIDKSFEKSAGSTIITISDIDRESGRQALFQLSDGAIAMSKTPNWKDWFDNAVQSLKQAFSDLKEKVTDLFRKKTDNPEGGDTAETPSAPDNSDTDSRPETTEQPDEKNTDNFYYMGESGVLKHIGAYQKAGRELRENLHISIGWFKKAEQEQKSEKPEQGQQDYPDR